MLDPRRSQRLVLSRSIETGVACPRLRGHGDRRRRCWVRTRTGPRGRGHATPQTVRSARTSGLSRGLPRRAVPLAGGGRLLGRGGALGGRARGRGRATFLAAPLAGGVALGLAPAAARLLPT